VTDHHPGAGSDEVESDPSSTNTSEETKSRRYLRGVRERAEALRSTAETRREGSRLVDIAFLVLERNRLLPATVLVGALASRVVIFVIPLLAALVFSVGFYADAASTSPADAARAAGMAGLFARLAQDSASAGNGIRIATALATVFALLWGANSLGRLIRRAHALVWGVPLESMHRPWILPLAVIGVSLVAMLLLGIGSWSENWATTVISGEVALEFVVVGSLWIFISRRLPHDGHANRWLDFLPGALLAATGIVAVRVAVVYYFAPKAVTLVDRYGTISIALVLLSWAYWLGFIIIGGADLNVAVFRNRSRRDSVA
jgi:uncharacterized BrkB/YihY/UPF0761 family membrane protein